MHVRLLDAEAAATARIGRMLGQQQQQLYSSAALLTGERSRLLTCYVQDYLECVESLPHDMQRNVSVLRELDNKYQGRGRGAAGLGSRWQGACRGSATFPFSRDSLPEPTEGLPSGTGRTGDWVRGPPCPRWASTSLGSPEWGWGLFVSPRCRPSGCSCRGGESAILSSKHLFRRSPAPCRRPCRPGPGLQRGKGRRE